MGESGHDDCVDAGKTGEDGCVGSIGCSEGDGWIIHLGSGSDVHAFLCPALPTEGGT